MEERQILSDKSAESYVLQVIINLKHGQVFHFMTGTLNPETSILQSEIQRNENANSFVGTSVYRTTWGLVNFHSKKLEIFDVCKLSAKSR